MGYGSLASLAPANTPCTATMSSIYLFMTALRLPKYSTYVLRLAWCSSVAKIILLW